MALTIGHAARARVKELVAEARRSLPIARARQSPDGVHDLRVATRRLRAAAELFGRCGAPALAPFDEALRPVTGALGDVRDLDVQRLRLEQELEAASGPEAVGVRRVLARVEAELPPREELLTLALDALDAEVLTPLERAAKEVDASQPVAGKRVKKRLRKLVGKLDERLEAARPQRGGHAPVLAAHRVRIALKHLRYALELTAPAFGAAGKTLRDEAKALQTLLGDQHDVDLWLRQLVRDLAAATPAEQPGEVRLLRRALTERDALNATAAAELARWRKSPPGRALRKKL